MILPVFAFILSCGLLHVSYPILIDHLDTNTPNFNELNEIKKHYVVKNLLKAVYLCILSVIGLPIVLLSFWGSFPNTVIKILAGLYCSNDIIGLYKVKQLPTSTRLHHSVTTLFLLASYAVDFETNRVAQMLFYYTFFSACAFPVNAFLGLRFCFDKDEIEDYERVAKFVYPTTCFINWIVQFYMVGTTFYDVAYCVLLVFIIYDDIILLKWLWKEHL